ncbi:MAG: ABC transporter permease [Oscillospiraceae bacterium]|nr:ABC transporter permease [Oscillospiraceae bacterium]
MTKIKNFVRNNQYTSILVGLLIAVLALFSALKGSAFWRIDLWKGMTMQFPEYACIALGLMFVFISGHHDMSQVLLGNFGAILAVQYMAANVTEGMANGQVAGIIFIGIGIALAIAVVGGLINFLLVSYLNVPPVMATIAMQMVWKGLSTALTKGYAVKGVPALYTTVGHTYIGGFLAVPVVIFLVLLVIAIFLLKFTTFGEKLYMIGTNKKAAKFSGINVHGMLAATYLLSAIFATIGVLIMVSTMGSAKADYGISYTTRAILILVLAGCIPDGGQGKISNILLSIVTVQIIATGINLFANLNTYYSSLIWGGMLIVVLIMSTQVGNRAPKKAKKVKKAPQNAA